MMIRGEENINFLVINKVADSLHSLIADGQYRATSLGRDTWKTLIGHQASLQINCNIEGFNARCSWEPNSRGRIGFVTNNETIVILATPELGLVHVEVLTIPVRVETQQEMVTMETNSLKPWATFSSTK